MVRLLSLGRWPFGIAAAGFVALAIDCARMCRMGYAMRTGCVAARLTGLPCDWSLTIVLLLLAALGAIAALGLSLLAADLDRGD